jgi:hypothetical protein
VNLYVCGHDHDVQHLEVDGYESTSFVMVGGGGAKVRPIRVDVQKRGPFARQSFGFGHLAFTPETMLVRLVDADGQVLHVFARDRAGGVRILDSSASDTATPRTAKSINRPDAEDSPTTKSSD